MNNQQIAVRTTNELDEKKDWAQAMSTGDLLPRQYQGKPGNLLFACEYADALGISRVHVLTSIAVINGRPSPSADLMSAMVRTAGHKLRTMGDDTYATATIIRKDDPDFEHTATWDIEKARKAGLWGNKGPWTNYPAAMLRSRAISEVVRMAATDVMAGAIYTPEELGANVDGEGNVINAPSERVQPQPRPTQASAATHIKDTLGGEPVQAEIPDGLLDKVAQAKSEADLAKIYEQHKAQPYWNDLKPALSSRKAEIQHDQQMADEAASQPELTGEVVEGEVA